MSPSSSITTGSIKGSNQENQSFGGRGYEERELEFWDEVEVLTWLTDQGFDYFVELFDGKLPKASHYFTHIDWQ